MEIFISGKDCKAYLPSQRKEIIASLDEDSIYDFENYAHSR